MAKSPSKNSLAPDKPASSDYLVGLDGAAPSTSNDGPTGKRGAVPQAAPRTTSCERCKGVFSSKIDELAYVHKRKPTCETCGAGAHFENTAVRWRKWDGSSPPDLPSDIHPLDSSDVWDGLGLPERTVSDRRVRAVGNAQDIPAGDVAYATRALRELTGDEGSRVDVAPSYITIYDAPPPGRRMAVDDAAAVDWKGWIIEKAGSTGNAAHRPAKGIRRPDAIYLALATAAQNPTWREWAQAHLNETRDKPGTKVARDGLAALFAVTKKVNWTAVAATTGLPRSTVYNLKGDGVKFLGQKSPNSEEAANVKVIDTVIHRCVFCPDWSATTSKEQTDHIVTVHGITKRKQVALIREDVATRDDASGIR